MNSQKSDHPNKTNLKVITKTEDEKQHLECSCPVSSNTIFLGRPGMNFQAVQISSKEQRLY